jgi:hypothetical protein
MMESLKLIGKIFFFVIPVLIFTVEQRSSRKFYKILKKYNVLEEFKGPRSRQVHLITTNSKNEQLKGELQAASSILNKG